MSNPDRISTISMYLTPKIVESTSCIIPESVKLVFKYPFNNSIKFSDYINDSHSDMMEVHAFAMNFYIFSKNAGVLWPILWACLSHSAFHPLGEAEIYQNSFLKRVPDA